MPTPPPRFRWIVLAAAFSGFFVSFLDRLAWPTASELASRSFSLPTAALGLFVTAFYAGYVVTSALSGFATDQIGPRRVLVLTLLLLAASTALFGLTTSWPMGVAVQALMGTFAGADYAACVKAVTMWFERPERGRALGVLSTAPSIGVGIANAVFPSVLAVVGWRLLYALLGTLTALIALACLILLRNAPPSGQARTFVHEDAGGFAWPWGVSMLVHDRRARLIAFAGFGANWGTWGFAFWATALMVREHNVSPVEAGIVTAIFGIAAAVSKPLFGLLSDLLRSRRGLVACDLAAFAAMLIVFGLTTSKSGLLMMAPFLGVTAFAYSPVLTAMLTEAVPSSMTASATGVTNAMWQSGNVVVPAVIGVVFAGTSSFRAAFAALAAGPLIGMLCVLTVREREPRHAVTTRQRAAVPDRADDDHGRPVAAVLDAISAVRRGRRTR